MFVRAKVAVFVDGDFWHGWQFPRWRHKTRPLLEVRRSRATANRDRRTSNKLRREGWLVIRIWEHDVERDAESCVDRIEEAVKKQAETVLPVRR